eukprot:10558791-Alexandrium_andersonii.AAC.1
MVHVYALDGVIAAWGCCCMCPRLEGCEAGLPGLMAVAHARLVGYRVRRPWHAQLLSCEQRQCCN